jgi:hypothetical protein
MAQPDEYDMARDRGAELRRHCPHAVAARYDRRIGRIMVRLNTGVELALAPRRIERLEHARPAQLAAIEISPSGFGLHFPLVDVDLHVPALLAGATGSLKWMAEHPSPERPAGGRRTATG